MPIVLLRGLAREAAHWGNFPEKLASHTQDKIEGRVILTPDIPGCGSHYQLKARSRMAENTDFVRQQLGFNKSTEPAPKTILIGLSMGGMIALDWAARYPAEISAICLINSSDSSQSIVKRIDISSWTTIILAALSKGAYAEKLMLNRVSNNRTNSSVQLNSWLSIHKARPVSKLNSLRMLVAASRFNAPSAIHCAAKSLIIYSETDKLVCPSCSINLSERYGLPRIMHASAGHDLPLDAPDWLANKLNSWLLQC